MLPPASLGARPASHKVDLTTFNFGNYSTSEQNTGFTWVDGKTIYKKTIYFGALPSGTPAKTVAHGISNLGRIIKIEQSITNGGSGFLQIASGVATANAFNIYGSATSISVSVNSDRSNCDAYFTIYYTKTSS